MNRYMFQRVQETHLLDIADRRFLRGHTTIELMIQAKTKDERYMVAVVSLLEVSEANRYSGMSEWEIEMVKRYHRIVKKYLISCDRVTVPVLSQTVALGNTIHI